MTKTPHHIKEKGERLYKERFRSKYEKKHSGKFLAIDITTEEAFVADTPEKAMEEAQNKNPNGFFHLVKIGSPGVYRIGYTRHTSLDRVF